MAWQENIALVSPPSKQSGTSRWRHWRGLRVDKGPSFDLLFLEIVGMVNQGYE